MKILTIVGARPQFIKAAAVGQAFKNFEDIEEVILHTGQHFDERMSDIFFNELNITKPQYLLSLGGLSHGAMTGRMMEGIEEICLKESPDLVMVYGDTNSTIAGALAAKKIHIKLAHVEAGLRSFNMAMPEEINRILTDRISDYLFCPTQSAIDNLNLEGFHHYPVSMKNVGDVMFDAVNIFSKNARKPDLELNDGFVLTTIHRAENTNDPSRMESIVAALNELSDQRQIVLPIHPRTKNTLAEQGLIFSENVSLIEPVSYLEMVYLLRHCGIVITDSGGLQKEAFFLKKPCITVRDETEWVELVQNGYNVLTGASKKRMISAFEYFTSSPVEFEDSFYGDGNSGILIAKELLK